MRAEKAARSGISGLDDILVGGFVPNRLHLIEGMPGTGKTTIGMQFLMAGRDAGEKVVYVSMSESREELEAVAESHGWSLENIEVCEVVPPDLAAEDANHQTMFHSSEIELGETTRLMLQSIERTDPSRIVIDSLSEMRLLAQSSLRYRRQIFALKHFLSRRKTTVLLLDDMTSDSRDLQLHSIAHGVLTLEQVALDYGAGRRRLRVTKMRGVKFRGGYHDYTIRTGGLEVFPRLIASEHPGRAPKEVASSGSAELDSMLGGGLRRGTTTLLLGPAGSGKSSIALMIAHAAATRGEPITLFAFDEGLDSIHQRATGLGMDLGAFEAARVQLAQINPAEMSPGEFTAGVRQSVREGARIIIIDSLNGYLNAMSNVRYLALELHELLTYLNQAGVITLLVLAQHGMVGNMQAPVDISYLSDSVLLLRFFEAEGRIRKAISVIKKRVGSHEDTIREFKLSGRGAEVGEPLVDFRGIMTGVPTYSGTQPLLKERGNDAQS